MTTARLSKEMLQMFAFYSLIALASIGAACGGGGAQQGPGGPGGAPPPMPVEIVTLAAKPVEQTTEYVATTKSLRSSTIQPEVEGFLTRIAVRSGERVTQGALLFEIDSAPEQAALGSLQSMRPMRESDVEFAQQQVARNKTLLSAGAISQREVEQFEAQLRAAEAQLKALDEQIRQQRSQLNYYRVTSPISGTVGDIPVNAGDRVTRTTVLTTVDENDVLEVYLNVPVPQAPQLKLGLPVRIFDDQGKLLATNRITFVSPNVDTSTQSVLAKAQLVEGRGQFRSDQFVRARVVWSTAPGLTIPVTAVTRINAQFFAFVAEKNDQGMVAKLKPVQLGEIIGNEYVLQSGLQVGEQLIVSGLQKIRDGSPVMPAPPAGAAPQAPKAP
ncbi:MAG TPA: efflux RND transporter periplasmic adaptor subunit [Vicinamibacterales bacterium]|nr:efflux RND transporter periplasmic adaptor subunit [Vicinamibacterales bacterium]